tara:strand:- start:2006 stop:3163 length:1158 start_codon:yes stop_codon:yes gene_type:complete
MATDTQTQIVREDPRMEALRLGILMDTKDMVAGRMGNEAALPPAYTVAGLTGLENQAAALGQAGIGAYVPYLQGATNQVTAGQNLIQDAALPTMGQGQEYLLESGRLAQQLREIPYQYQTAAGEGLLASAGTFDPSTQVSNFYNPYEENVIQQTMQDIADQGAIQQQQARANAVSSGAFGGSRSGIMESELAKNMLREQGRAAGNLRNQGYGAAQAAAQQAFENTQNRRMQASQGIGNLGINYGQLSQADVGQMQSIGQGLGGFANQYAGLGAQSANLGLQQAGLGEMAQRSNLSDIQTLTGIGAMQRGQQQAVLDATRNSNVERLAAPYQQLGFLSDMARGTPTSQSTISSRNSQDPSTAQQVLGLGIAGLGAIGGARTGLGFG